jgi:restriction system protein
MTLPNYHTLLLPVLKLAAEGEAKVLDTEDRIAHDLGLSTEERERLLPSGKQRVLHNRVHWAKFYLTKAKLVEVTRRGHFQITDRGRALLAEGPSTLDSEMLCQYPEFAAFMGRTDARFGLRERMATRKYANSG